MTQHDELLVVRSAGADPHVPQAFTAGGLDVLTEMPVLLLAEREPVQVRAPHQALDHHSPPCRVGEDPRDLGARAVQELVGIAAPIGEHQQVAGPQRPHAAEQLSEVRLAMDQRGDVIADGERRAVGVAAVQPGGRIAALGRTEEPPGDGHGDIQPRPAVNGTAGIGSTSRPVPTAGMRRAASPDSLPHDSRRPEDRRAWRTAALIAVEVRYGCPPALRRSGGFDRLTASARRRRRPVPAGSSRELARHCSPPRSASSA